MRDKPDSPLAERVYIELKKRLDEGRIRPGQFINLPKLGEELAISRTPLRDALIRLELEGFVNIYPQRGVMVRSLGLSEIRDMYEIIGALESLTAEQASSKFRTEDYDRMEELCCLMEESIHKDDFSSYYDHNLAFHNVYIELSSNLDLLRDIQVRKERLYDFPRKSIFVKDWEEASNAEHRKILEFFKAKNFTGAASYIRNVHWSYDVQAHFIRRYYIEVSDHGR